MEALGINWKILIGQLINFAILFFLLKKFAYKPFLSLLEKRRTKIEEGVKKSEEAERSLQKIRMLEEDVRKSGEEKARRVLRESEAKASAVAEGILAVAGKEKERIILEAKASAEREIAAAKERHKEKMLENTFLIAEKFLKEKVDEKEDRRFLEKVISEMK